MTPIVMLLALVATHSSDAAYVVLIPLSGVIYASVGRHPIAGIAAAFAGVSGGFSANFMPGPIDALILGVTEPAVHIIDPTWTVNVAGNWYFILGMAIVFFPHRLVCHRQDHRAAPGDLHPHRRHAAVEPEGRQPADGAPSARACGWR